MGKQRDLCALWYRSEQSNWPLLKHKMCQNFTAQFKRSIRNRLRNYISEGISTKLDDFGIRRIQSYNTLDAARLPWRRLSYGHPHWGSPQYLPPVPPPPPDPRNSDSGHLSLPAPSLRRPLCFPPGQASFSQERKSVVVLKIQGFGGYYEGGKGRWGGHSAEASACLASGSQAW